MFKFEKAREEKQKSKNRQTEDKVKQDPLSLISQMAHDRQDTHPVSRWFFPPLHFQVRVISAL